MQLYSAMLKMEQQGFKEEFTLYFASERHADSYLEQSNLAEEGTYVVEKEWMSDEVLLDDYNGLIEQHARNSLNRRCQAGLVSASEAKVETCDVVKEVEVIREVEPKLWWVEVGNDAPVIFRSWSEVQEMLSRIEEETYELDINIKPISVRELVLQFNALSEE